MFGSLQSFVLLLQGVEVDRAAGVALRKELYKIRSVAYPARLSPLAFTALPRPRPARDGLSALGARARALTIRLTQSLTHRNEWQEKRSELVAARPEKPDEAKAKSKKAFTAAEEAYKAESARVESEVRTRDDAPFAQCSTDSNRRSADQEG